jgi:hypothetical protein
LALLEGRIVDGQTVVVDAAGDAVTVRGDGAAVPDGGRDAEPGASAAAA